MHKYMTEVFNYIEQKIVLGIVAVVFTDDFFKLIAIFAALEILDIITRWVALSYKCFKNIYPDTKCGISRAFRFMWQARKWRFIRSDGLRQGCDKILLYLLLLLTASLVDAALQIGHAPRALTTIVVIVLSSTEALSILENLSECRVDVVTEIKNRVKQHIATSKR